MKLCSSVILLFKKALKWPLQNNTNKMSSNTPQEVGVLPKILDVEWKLEVVTNTPGAGSDNLLYTVILKTDRGQDIRFTAGIQQLQDLVYKVKHLVRHCEKQKTDIS